MRHAMRTHVIGFCLLSGCAIFVAPESRYLQLAQGRASEEEVAQRLGRPAAAWTNQTGETVWVYQVREQEAGNRWTSTGLWCDEYVVTFDRHSVVRSWTHQSHFHGGELMPLYCVPNGFKGPLTVKAEPRREDP
jgi:hypothetical protein